MDSHEAQTHSFVIRVWREELGEDGNQGVWRGHITHAVSGKRSYLKNLEDISKFIAPYLKEEGF